MSDTASAAVCTALTAAQLEGAKKLLAQIDAIDNVTHGWTDKVECRLTGISYHAKFEQKVPTIDFSVAFAAMLSESPIKLADCLRVLIALQEGTRAVLLEVEQILADAYGHAEAQYQPAALAALARIRAAIGPVKVTACRVCGCTDDRACDGGCSWVEPDLCSACAS